MILVNPSCEAALLFKVGFLRRRWRISTLDRFTNSGFHRGTASSPPPPVQGLEIHLDLDAVTVARLNESGGFIWKSAINEDVYRKARAHNLLVIGVTSALDPPNGLSPDLLEALVAQRKIAYTIAPITRFSRPAQALSKDDFDEERKLNGFAALYEMSRQKLGVETAAEPLGVADALVEGVDLKDDFRRLARRDQILAALLLAGLYVAQRGPVHLMTPDPATTQDYEKIFRQVLVPLRLSVERADKQSQTPGKSVVLGTQEEFAAAWSRPTSAVSGAIGRGSLAVVVAPGPEFFSKDFMSRYARLVEV
jgi:hypothetical protein